MGNAAQDMQAAEKKP